MIRSGILIDRDPIHDAKAVTTDTVTLSYEGP